MSVMEIGFGIVEDEEFERIQIKIDEVEVVYEQMNWSFRSECIEEDIQPFPRKPWGDA